MARFIAIDWDHQHVHVVEATTNKDSVTILKAFSWEDQDSPNLTNAAELGKKLRARMREAGMTTAPVLACVGRDRLILREIRFPSVSAAEEPAIVRFQAVKELSHAPEEVVIDYVVAGNAAEGAQKQALVFILRRELLTAYQLLCRAAGLNLAAMTPRSLGIAWSVLAKAQQANPTSPNGAVAVATLSPHWAEFSVIHDQGLRLARSLTTPTSNESALLNEVRRNLNVYAAQSPQFPCEVLYLAGSRQQNGLSAKWQEQLNVPVVAIDPFAGQKQANLPDDNRGGYCGAVGLLYAQAQRRAASVNFCKPREPQVQRDPNNLRAVAAAALLGLAVLGGVIYGYLQISAKDELLKRLNAEKLFLDSQLATSEDDARKIKAIGDWSATRIIWLDELYDLTDRFPDDNSLRVTQFSAVPATRTAKDNHVAQISLQGVANNDHQAVDDLINHMRNDGYYSVEPKKMTRNRTVEQRRFAQQFEIRAEVLPRPPEEYNRELKASPPERNRARANGSDAGFNFGEVLP